ncbi:MAG: trypsin-like peptidase domain-containing protein [Oscillospiraceae bacterium]|nr:trypsin-like peptidase domain-containing protein [Oscillospiraceae bacterium]
MENNHPWTYEFDSEPEKETNKIPEAPIEEIKEEPKKKKEKKPVSIGLLIVILALACSILGGIVGAAISGGGEGILSSGDASIVLEGERPTSVIEINKIDTTKVMTPAEVYATNVNSTVGITTAVTTNYWGYQTTSAASGSGFILSADGYIITNQHVIENSSAITVSFYDGTSLPAELVGYDASNDIAVLKVEATDLTPVVLGDSSNMNVGDEVVAIGNPLGELTFSLTTGAVSALSREVTVSSGVTMNLIQTDCAINSGNSGGALFNLYGEVVGITNAKYSSSSASEASIDNIGFAIPVNSIRGIVESIIEKGYITKPYIGVSVTDVSAETQSYGLPMGAAVKEIIAGSPAESAGLQVNDIITAVNDTAITGSNDLVKIIGESSVGDTLTLKVFRQGAEMELTLTVGEKVQSALEQENVQQQEQQSSGSIFDMIPWPFDFGF